VRQVLYGFYGIGDANGNAGDLKLVQGENGDIAPGEAWEGRRDGGKW
jgi:hypothetical protein